tara:strand:+ start:1472 stop:2503 length:1032 start_codon:yes stop_codon:yes gene_type:complete
MSNSANSALQTQWQNSELNVEHHTAQINGIDLHFVTQGDGLPVIFCHGVPHLWYTWHKQLPVVAAAGYKAVAIDVRGMGYSDTPQNKADYPGQTTLDLLGVLDYLGEEQAVFSGFDIGMNAIWDLAVRAPERVAGIIAFNTPILAAPGMPGDTASVSPDFIKMGEEHFYHVTWYNKDPVGNVVYLDSNTKEFIRRLIWGLSGEYKWIEMLKNPPEATYLDVLPVPPPLPWDWFTEDDLDEYVKAYKHSGFQGVVNHYTSFRFPLPSPPENPGRQIEEPVAFICGDRDMDLIDVEIFGKLPLETMRQRCTDLREVIVVREAGHLIHMEKPDEVNAGILRFLKSL